MWDFFAREKSRSAEYGRDLICVARKREKTLPRRKNMNTAQTDGIAEGVEPHRKRYRAQTTRPILHDSSVFSALCTAHPLGRRRDRTQISSTLYTILPRLSTVFFIFGKVCENRKRNRLKWVRFTTETTTAPPAPLPIPVPTRTRATVRRSFDGEAGLGGQGWHSLLSWQDCFPEYG